MAIRGRKPGISLQPVLPLALLTKRMQAAIVADQLKMAKDIKKDFDKTTKTWKHRPKMQVRVKHPIRVMDGKAMLEINIGPDPLDPDAKIFTFVDLGTKKHRIPKVGNTTAKPLYFQWGGPGSYKAKTKPRALGSTAGGSTGPFITRMSVMHPGTEARKFSETIARRWGQLGRKYLPKTMTKVVQVSGHSMKGR